MFVILGFYKFKRLKLLKKKKLILQNFFLDMNIRGSIIISKEGLNGSISGKSRSISLVKKKLKIYLILLILIVKTYQKVNFTRFINLRLKLKRK